MITLFKCLVTAKKSFMSNKRLLNAKISYLEVDYDLSDVMFVTTANTLNILPPLLDRMEVIRLSGYTEDEKVNISQKYLIPNQSKNNGLKSDEWGIDENINRKIIRHFTRESGVRNLEREISKIARKLVKKIDNSEKINNPIHEKDLKNLLGVEKFNYGEIEEELDQQKLFVLYQAVLIVA